MNEADILAFFDAALDKGQWPELFGRAKDRAYHTMRLLAVRSATGWGVIFERLEGDGWDGNMASPYTFAPTSEWLGWVRPIAAGLSEESFSLEDEDALEAAEARGPFALDGLEAIGPAGSLELEDAMIADLDLRPGRVTALGVKQSRYSLCLRAYLAKYPSAFYRDPDELVPLLRLPGETSILLVSDAFEHCVGRGSRPEYPASYHLRPSGSPVYQSLARALVAGDASLFEPGASNLDFRLHALLDTGE